jgi:hypothetical protein
VNVIGNKWVFKNK